MFELVRKVQAKLGVTAEDLQEQSEWSRDFHGMHDPAAASSPAEDTTEPPDHPAGMRAKRK